jgi:hypothetical protein
VGARQDHRRRPRDAPRDRLQRLTGWDEPGTRVVTVPFGRLPGWIERYDLRHPGTSWLVESTRVTATSPEGASAVFAVPFGPLDRLDLAGLHDHLARPWQLGVVLVRRGGFAIAYAVGPEVRAVKIGRRHVQGRTKAGGWSQQRFARRRDNQAREAFDAAAGHAKQILVPVAAGLDLLVLGGDRVGVQTVLDDRRLTALSSLPQLWATGVADPRRPVLDAVVDQARSVGVELVDPQPG